MQKDKPKLLITGAGGQLGRELARLASDNGEFEFLLADRHTIDIRTHRHVLDAIGDLAPAAVINCAAYTNVEQAETEPEEAMLANDLGAGYVAEACHKAGALLVHFSTDYVFDGNKSAPYREEDLCAPLSVYGKSKWEGEKKIDMHTQRHFILRTSWLYSAYGHNFFKTMLRLAKERGELNVVDDQIASPTYAGFLAADVLTLMKRVLVDRAHVDYGIYHYTQSGETSWYGFATEIIAQSGMQVPVHAVHTGAFPTKAKRPHYSKLDTTKFASKTQIAMQPWQEGVRACMALIRNQV
ncbi:MAG: dTDP-4-dehydrorhamnose reductase [Flavobacteriales bacterium]|nr:dTDP-4-dehydrorhamnose reductase [Flavobacteriales bacterium]